MLCHTLVSNVVDDEDFYFLVVVRKFFYTDTIYTDYVNVSKIFLGLAPHIVYNDVVYVYRFLAAYFSSQ